MGLVAVQHVGSSWTRGQTHVSCIGRQILYHLATRETQIRVFFFSRVVPQRLLGRFLKYRVLASTLDQNQKLEEGLEICVFNPSKNLPGCSNMALALESVILDGVPTGA